LKASFDQWPQSEAALPAQQLRQSLFGELAHGRSGLVVAGAHPSTGSVRTARHLEHLSD
jgi:hypothetical protein